MDKSKTLLRYLKQGQVYRRADLEQWTNAVDRHLQELVGDHTLQKLSHGLYYYPKKTAFGVAPPEENVLVRSFLKDDNFLLTSPNAYNALGVGTTQLYNKRVVYNHKRHGEFELGGREFFFHVKPRFPKKATLEFLLVDLVNNLDNLAEDPEAVLPKVKERAKAMDAKKLRYSVKTYGGVKAKHIFRPVLDALQKPSHAN